MQVHLHIHGKYGVLLRDMTTFISKRFLDQNGIDNGFVQILE